MKGEILRVKSRDGSLEYKSRGQVIEYDDNYRNKTIESCITNSFQKPKKSMQHKRNISLLAEAAVKEGIPLRMLERLSSNSEGKMRYSFPEMNVNTPQVLSNVDKI